MSTVILSSEIVDKCCIAYFEMIDAKLEQEVDRLAYNELHRQQNRLFASFRKIDTIDDLKNSYMKNMQNTGHFRLYIDYEIYKKIQYLQSSIRIQSKDSLNDKTIMVDTKIAHYLSTFVE